MVILVSSLLSWFLSNTLALCPSFDVLISNLETKHPYLGVHMPYGVNVTWNSSICSSGIALRPSFDVSIPNLQPEPPYLGFTCYNVTWNSSISSSGNQQLCSHALITFSQWWHVSFLIDYIYAFFFLNYGIGLYIQSLRNRISGNSDNQCYKENFAYTKNHKGFI